MLDVDKSSPKGSLSTKFLLIAPEFDGLSPNGLCFLKMKGIPVAFSL